MNKKEITTFLTELTKTKERNLVIVDFANVNGWKKSTGWPISIKKLGQLTRILSGKKFLRRFYYGEDYGKKDSSTTLLAWSNSMLSQARMSSFELITKRVKYIIDSNYATGYVKKCDLDVEMTLDLIKEKDNYDKVVIFSGDGDLGCVCRYLYEEFGKEIYFFGARNHIGKEIIDAHTKGVIKKILFVEDFDYRLDLNRS